MLFLVRLVSENSGIISSFFSKYQIVGISGGLRLVGFYDFEKVFRYFTQKLFSLSDDAIGWRMGKKFLLKMFDMTLNLNIKILNYNNFIFVLITLNFW